MLRHSLLQPQMFLNSWFPQVAVLFSLRYCADYFSARSTWMAHDRTQPTFFFFFFLAQKHRTQGPLNNSASCATHWFLHTTDSFEALEPNKILRRASFLQSCVDISINSHIWQNKALIMFRHIGLDRICATLPLWKKIVYTLHFWHSVRWCHK